MADDTQAILQALLESGALTQEQATGYLSQIEQNPGLDLFDLLVKDQAVDEETYVQTAANLAGLPYVALADKQIPKEVLSIVPESTAREHMVIAYEQTPEKLSLAMADASDRQIVEFIRKKVDRDVEIALASPSAIRGVLGQYNQSLESELGSMIDPSAKVEVVDEDVTPTGEALGEAAEELPVVKIAETILKHSIVQGASDVHIEPTETQVVVRYRIDGILRDVMVLPKRAAPGLVARIKVLANLKIDEHRLPQDGRFKIETEDYKVSFRVSILPVFDGEKIVMRLLDESGEGLSLEDIGMRERALKVFRNNITKPHGMVLVTGPTGSGKTTTLYAAMREMNKPEVNISTIEDPIEYRMQRINQTQVRPRIGLTFAAGLRSLVRQDPDILMVGEIRDEETASLAVNAALTGHLVFSTLHTNSAAGSIPRLEDMNVETFLIASTLNAVVAQRLVRRLCDKCKKESALTQEMVDEISTTINLEAVKPLFVTDGILQEGDDFVGQTIFEPEGCSSCTDGYKGRSGIYEVMEITPAVQKIFKAGVTAQELEEVAREDQGMMTLLEDGFGKVLEGVTTVQEIMRVAKE